MFSDLPLLKDKVIRSLDVIQLYEDAISAMLGSSVRLGSADSNGWHKKIKCPLHDDEHPSFCVNSVTGGFKCWAGGCNQVGSIFDFWIIYKGYRKELDFAKALAELAELARIDVKDWQKSKEYKASATQAKKLEAQQLTTKTETRAINKAAENDTSKLPIEQKIVEEFQTLLGPDDYQYLCTTRGLTLETIKKYRLGYDPTARVRTVEGSYAMGRYTIPIYNAQGECRNIRLYSPLADSAYKMLNYRPDKEKPGYGSPPRIFGAYALMHKKIHSVCLCEGEFDTILLNQKFEQAGLIDWLAITNTHGAGTFEIEWLELLYNKSIYFIYDCDEPGKRESASHCSKYFLTPLKAGRFTAVKNIILPLDGTKEYKDLTDYFVKLNRGLDELLMIIQATPPLESGGVSQDEATVPPIDVDNLNEAVKNREYIDKRIRVPLTIVGSTSTRYHAVRSYRVTHCPLATTGGTQDEGECCNDFKEKLIRYGDQLFIHSAISTGPALQNRLQFMACSKLQKCRVEIVKKVVMEQYLAQQTIKRFLAKENTEGRMENVHDISDVSIYYLQPEAHLDIEPRDYMAVGWIRSHPQTSITTIFVEELEPLANDWENFEVTEAVKQDLQVFSQLSFYEILTDISDHVTHIYNSPRILAAVLLAYCSPIWINFNGTIIRGWINACVIGDSGVGKSSTYMRIADYIDVGDLFSMLTGSRTGLLYNLQKRGGEWKLHIGRYVSADRKIIAIDEAQEAEPFDIKSMALAMDSGRLDIAKVQQATYSTRARTILLLNPPEGQTLANFAHGCTALAACFSPMFIRRLDLAIFSPSQQDNAFYNRGKADIATEGKISAIALRNLVYWAWTRTSAQIQWEPEATDYCLLKATELANEYGDALDVPLLNPADCRLTLARLSTAHAILTGQFGADMESCVVKKSNVLDIVCLLRDIYSDVTCNLGYYSGSSKSKNTLTEEEYGKIKAVFEKLIQGVSFGKHGKQQYNQPEKLFCQLLQLLQTGQEYKSIELRDNLCTSVSWVKHHMSALSSFKLVEAAKFGYKTTPKFNRFMGRWVNEDWADYDSTGMPIQHKVKDMLANMHIPTVEKIIGLIQNTSKQPEQTNDEYYEAQRQPQNGSQKQNGRHEEDEMDAGSLNDTQDDPFYMEFGELED